MIKTLRFLGFQLARGRIHYSLSDKVREHRRKKRQPLKKFRLTKSNKKLAMISKHYFACLEPNETAVLDIKGTVRR